MSTIAVKLARVKLSAHNAMYSAEEEGFVRNRRSPSIAAKYAATNGRHVQSNKRVGIPLCWARANNAAMSGGGHSGFVRAALTSLRRAPKSCHRNEVSVGSARPC